MITVIQKKERSFVEMSDSKGGILAMESFCVVRSLYDYLTEHNKIGAEIFRSLLTEHVNDGIMFDEKYKGENK